LSVVRIQWSDVSDRRAASTITRELHSAENRKKQNFKVKKIGSMEKDPNLKA
jgi:hypothetical protein